ncbi:hypothetical protein ACG7TL_007497 [Trametes sanguinea]
MSSEQAAELVATYQSVFIANAIDNAVTAFLVYDWLLCLDEETHFIWPRAKSGASVLYLLNHYLLLFYTLWGFVGLATLSDELDFSTLGSGSDDSSYILAFLDPLTSILISHFILNLRAANDPSSASIHSSFVDGELQFAQQQELVNSMDGPVHTLSNNHSQSVDQIEMEDMGVEEDMGAEERANVEERDAVQV